MNANTVEMNAAMLGLSSAMPSPKGDRQAPEVVEAPPVSSEQVKQMVAEMQSQIEQMNVSLEFSTYGDHGEKIAIVVTSKETGEVIREIPPKEIQNLYARMSELVGIIFNREV